MHSTGTILSLRRTALLCLASLAGILGLLLGASAAFAEGTPLNINTPGITSGVAGAGACSVKLLGTIIGAGSAVTGGIIGAGAVAAPPGLAVADYGVRAGIIGILPNQTAQTAIQANNTNTDFMSCIARSLARAALQQMTVSVVNWINSGFKGSPSFVTNYQQFFTQIADNAVGNFLAGSDLAFLCSPFKLQVKIAVAQAYARRGGGQQCSISKVVTNLEGFMKNFNQGGWQGLLSFTTTPTNNPYGAFADAQVKLGNSISSIQGQKGLDLQLGRGFLSFEEEKNCMTMAVPPPQTPNVSIKAVGINNGVQQYRVCTVVVSTPGSTIANQLDATLQTNFRQLELAQSFDQIINALISQLLVKTLYGGLSNVSNQQGFNNNPNDLAGAASSFAQNLDDIRAAAVQHLDIVEDDVADITAAQVKVDELGSCWGAHATSTALTSAERSTARLNASSTASVDDNLERARVHFNSRVTSIATQIATLDDYKDRALSTLNVEQFQKLVQEFMMVSSRSGFVGPASLPAVEQERDRLSSELASLNADTAAKLNKCHDFPPPPPTT